MTDPIEIMARAMGASRAWPAVFAPGSAVTLSQAALKALSDAGFVVVPREPTEEAIDAGLTTGNRFGPTAMANIYRTLIAAAQVTK